MTAPPQESDEGGPQAPDGWVAVVEKMTYRKLTHCTLFELRPDSVTGSTAFRKQNTGRV